MNQLEIDELLQSSDEQIVKNSKTKQNLKMDDKDFFGDDYSDQDFEEDIPDKPQPKKQQPIQFDQYSEEFQEEQISGDQAIATQQQITKVDRPSEKIVSQQSIVKSQQQGGFDQMSQIQSEFASQIHDEVAEDLNNDDQNWFKKDDEMSIAQSEFIDSENMDKSQKDKSKAKINSFVLDEKKDGKRDMKKESKRDTKKVETNKIRSGKIVDDRKIQKKKVQPKQPPNKPNKPKLSEEEILEKMKKVQEQKKRLENIKKQKEEKEKQKKKKQYQEALEKQKERKQLNKKAYEEQMKKKNHKSEHKIPSKANLEDQAQKAIEKAKEPKSNLITQEEKRKRKQAEIQMEKAVLSRNKEKLKQLEPVKVPIKIQGEEKKKNFWKETHAVKQVKVKQKNKQDQEVDTVIIKQLKHQIKQQRQDNQAKRKKIFEFEKQIQALKSKLKSKQKILYSGQSTEESDKHQQDSIHTHTNFTDLSPVEKFVSYFPEAHTSEEIFNLIDQNRDGMLTLAEIMSKIADMGIESDIIEQVHTLLDQNSDGNITIEQFSFIIEQEIKRQRDYRQIMEGINIIDPIEIEAKIIDMRAKINFMDSKIEKQTIEGSNAHQEKYKLFLQKLQKIQKKMKLQKEALTPATTNQVSQNTAFLLAEQAEKLASQQKILKKIIKSLQQGVSKNIQSKNKHLLSKVEQNLRLQEQVYRMKNQIQETQLRFLSMKKIKENKRGYIQKQNQTRSEMEDLYRKAKQYQIKVADPTKQIKNKTYMSDIKFLSAVIMIQRNFRKKKAQRQAVVQNQ